MPRFNKSHLSVAIVAGLISQASTAATSQIDEDSIERLSVYGRHNQLILESGTATKSNMELMDTPAAIVVVDKLLFEQQAVAILQDVIPNISGLTYAGSNFGIGDNLTIRGLGVQYAFDGMYGGAGLGNTFNSTRSMTNIESVEVLKGPATGLYGFGPAGGVVNLIEKKPLDKEQTHVRVKVGEWQRYAGMFDTTAPINDKSAYRLVVAHESVDGYRNLGAERSELYASVNYQLNNDNEFLLSAAYIDDANQVDSVGDPVRIFNHASLADPNGPVTADTLVNDESTKGLQLTPTQRQELANSIDENTGLGPISLGGTGLISPLSKPNEGSELRVKLRHDLTFSSDTQLTQQVQYRSYDSNFTRQTGAFNYVYWERRGVINANPRAPLVIDDVLYPYAARRQEYRNQISSEDSIQYFADLNSTWQFGDIEGEHLLSVNYEDRDISVIAYSAKDADGDKSDNPIPYILDIRNPNWPTGDFGDYASTVRTNYDKTVTAYGISLQEVVYLSKQLTARAGFAYNTIEQTYQSQGTARSPGVGDKQSYEDSGTAYNLGLNYRIIDELAVFAGFSKGNEPYGVTSELTSSRVPDPRPNAESESTDIGIRFTAFDQDLIGSIVWFDTRRTNLRRNNLDYNDDPNDPEYNIDVPQYFYDDEDKSTGVEFDLNFALAESWSLNANYTTQDVVTIRAKEESQQTKGMPENFARIWTEYKHRFSGLDGDFAFRLGYKYEDEKTVDSLSFGLPDAKLDSYKVWDAGVAYQTENWDLNLNIQNLTDETYYIRAAFLGGIPGNARNMTLTFNYKL